MFDHFLMIMIMSIISIFMIMFFGIPTKTSATQIPLMIMIMIIMSLVRTKRNGSIRILCAVPENIHVPTPKRGGEVSNGKNLKV